MTKTTLSTDILRRLALMQHLGEGFLILNGIAYGGNHQELWDEWRTLETSQTFAEFVAENCTEVEELDADDYTIDYMVLTDDEADEKWEESLDNYIEECIQPEIDKLDSLGNLQY
jgi:hypothetical protein